MNEEWRDIEGYPGYQVSSTGKVRSFMNNRHGIGETSHLLATPLNKSGYKTVRMGRGKRHLVSRLVANAYIDNPNNLPFVRHMDDNPLNNNVDNLKWGTQKDNMQDCVKHGRLVGDTRAAINARKKKIKAIPLKGGGTVIFSSINDAARELGLWPQHVSRVANGELRQTGGYYFEFVREGDD